MLFLGNDGNRYSFGLDDIANLSEYSSHNLAGYQVDFEIDEENKAKDIFILNKASFWSSLIGESVNSVRLKFLIAMRCLFVSFCFRAISGFISLSRPENSIFFTLSIICVIFYCVFWILATIGLSRASGIRHC